MCWARRLRATAARETAGLTGVPQTADVVRIVNFVAYVSCWSIGRSLSRNKANVVWLDGNGSLLVVAVVHPLAA
jgi:prepilin-type processing-associated H-X9-DG protein